MPGINDYINIIRNGLFSKQNRLSGIAFIDIEVGVQDKKAHDFGAIKESGETLHIASKQEFANFIADAEYLCGHNIIHHDLKYLSDIPGIQHQKKIDTLYVQFAQEKPKIVKLYTIAGALIQEVIPTKETLELTLPTKGIFILSCEMKEGTVVRKIVNQ